LRHNPAVSDVGGTMTTGGCCRRLLRLGLALLALICPFWRAPAAAQEITYNGLVDGRVVDPSNQRSWMRGGLGKLRFNGGGDSGPEAVFDQATVDGKIGIGPDVAVLGTLRFEPTQRTEIDMLEGYVRYQPLSSGPWRARAKAGAFFPPISLENEGIGWTSPWTLTPSAINSWVGEELRTIGGESSAQWRYDGGSLEATGALFGWAGPAGTLLSDRGWALGDKPTGLLDRLRLPDVVERRQRKTLPQYEEPFLQIGGSPGWYAGSAWRIDGLGRIAFLHYDNEADTSAFRNNQVGWRTKFNSVGIDTGIGDVVLLAQAMAGNTEIDPTANFHSNTWFHSAYLLAGRYFGDWSVAGRLEFFGTRERHDGGTPELSEHGHAGTLAVSWRPLRMLKITGEALRVESYRLDRINAGLDPRAVENQYQISARVLF